MKAFDFLTEKARLESELAASGPDEVTLIRYLDLLCAANRECAGLLSFVWPGVPYPMYFRAGSSDLSNFIQIFRAHEYGFGVARAPRRILDLGGYVGFAAIYLALRFPDAELVSVEPSSDNFRVHTMNTLPYGNIKRLNAAVWGESSRLSLAQFSGGDWGARFVEAAAGASAAYAVRDILGMFGWSSFDFLKCDIEGAEASVFAHSGRVIADMIDCCAVETHDAVAPDSSATVARSFAPDAFSHGRSGEFDVFMRRVALPRDARPPPAALLRPAAGIRRIELANVSSEGWGYYTFDGGSCQIHPAEAHAEPGELRTAIRLDGHASFETGLRVDNPLGFDVDFALRVVDADGLTVASGAVRVGAGEQRSWRLPFDALFGEHVVSLQTRMAPGTPTSHQAVACWLDPRLT